MKCFFQLLLFHHEEKVKVNLFREYHNEQLSVDQVADYQWQCSPLIVLFVVELAFAVVSLVAVQHLIAHLYEKERGKLCVCVQTKLL